MKKLLSKRVKDTHKGDCGRVLVLAGSPGMLGASILATRGALRVGAGLVYLGAPSSCRDIVNIATPEVIVIGADKAGDLAETAKNADVIAIGPGLGSRKNIGRDLLNIIHDKPVILDADGIFEPAEMIKLSKLIITPHPGEMAKLLNISVSQVQKDRKLIAKETAKKLNATVVLKGYQTVIADPTGKVEVNSTGNPGLATAGSGDVLTGMIAGLVAQGFTPSTAVHLHGLAGDLAAKKLGEYSLIASDIIDHIPEAMKKCSRT